MIRVVPAVLLHTRDMVKLLNDALKTALTADDVKERMSIERSIWSVAETEMGAVLGFQWIEPVVGRPANEAEIATIVRDGQSLEIGSSLFARTKTQAKTLGYGWISAEVRPNNERSLSYFQSKGFEVIHRADKILMRYEV